MADLLRASPDAKILFETDSPNEVGKGFETAFKGIATVSTRQSLSSQCLCTARQGKLCTQIALAELIFLSKAKSILTSDWSSASEFVVRLTDSEHGSGCSPPTSDTGDMSSVVYGECSHYFRPGASSDRCASGLRCGSCCCDDDDEAVANFLNEFTTGHATVNYQ